MSGHTPGPWTFDLPTAEQHPGYLFGGKDICIWAGSQNDWLANVEHRACCVHPNSLGCHPEGYLLVCTLTDEINAEQEANARLIAAAPDLLYAAKHALRNLNGPNTDLDVLRAAILKAEGTEPIGSRAEQEPATYHPTAVAVTLTGLIRDHLRNCLRTIRGVDCPDLLRIVDEWAKKIALAGGSPKGESVAGARCVCHYGSVCTTACLRGMHHEGCLPSNRPAEPKGESV